MISNFLFNKVMSESEKNSLNYDALNPMRMH